MVLIQNIISHDVYHWQGVCCADRILTSLAKSSVPHPSKDLCSPDREVDSMGGEGADVRPGANESPGSGRVLRSAASSRVSTPSSQKSKRGRSPDGASGSAPQREESLSAPSSSARRVLHPGGDGAPSSQDRAANTRVRTFLYSSDRVDSQLTIFQLQWYMIDLSGMSMNLRAVTTNTVNYGRMLQHYTDQVEGVAASFWTYMTDPNGGAKEDSLWTNGRDRAWLQKRLIYKSNTLADAQKMTGKYLWAQWNQATGLRSQIQEEAWPAWCAVTKNGSEVIQSGKDIMHTKNMLMQMWYENSFDRHSKNLDKKTVKAQSAKLWENAGYSVHQDDRPREECCVTLPGHGSECQLGQMPPKHELPKAYFVMMCLSPLASYLDDYYKSSAGPNAAPPFPPFKPSQDFADLFGCQTLSGSPAPCAADGWAPRVRDTSHLTRHAMELADRDEERDDVFGDVAHTMDKLVAAATKMADGNNPSPAGSVNAADMMAAQAQAEAAQAQLMQSRVNLAVAYANVDANSDTGKFLAAMMADTAASRVQATPPMVSPVAQQPRTANGLAIDREFEVFEQPRFHGKHMRVVPHCRLVVHGAYL